MSRRDRAYLKKYYKAVAAKAKEYGVDPALVLGLGGESGFGTSPRYQRTGDAFGMTGGKGEDIMHFKSPEANVNELFKEWGDQIRGAGSDVMKFLHGLEQEDANGNQLTMPGPDGNQINVGHIWNSVNLPPTEWINRAKTWIDQMNRDIPIYLSGSD